MTCPDDDLVRYWLTDPRRTTLETEIGEANALREQIKMILVERVKHESQ